MPKIDPLSWTDSQLEDEVVRTRLREDLIFAFPHCRGEVDEFLRVMTAQKQRPAPDLPIEDAVLEVSSLLPVEKQAHYAKLDFLFCSLRSQCPAEANAFLQCSERFNPGLRQFRPSEVLDREPPPPCRALWTKFDQCLIRKTEEFERKTQE